MIKWQENRCDLVAQALSRSTPSNCEAVAAETLPLARKQDLEAAAYSVSVDPGCWPHSHDVDPILPLDSEGRKRVGLAVDDNWYSHTTVGLEQHFLDCLTGPEGCEEDSYLSSFFDYDDLLRVQPCST